MRIVVAVDQSDARKKQHTNTICIKHYESRLGVKRWELFKRMYAI